MSDSTLPHEKIQAPGAGIAASVHDSLHDLTQRSKEAALEAEHRIEREIRHARHIAENYIHHAPLKSVLIAAATGAATALVVSWLMHLRKH